MKLLAAALAIAFASLTACTTTENNANSVLARLQNKGLVPLSSNNPYIASNVALAKEMEFSPELYGFIKNRGAPEVIEVSKIPFGTRIVKFYYVADDEFYNLESLDGTWSINGPRPLARSRWEELRSVARYVRP